MSNMDFDRFCEIIECAKYAMGAKTLSELNSYFDCYGIKPDDLEFFLKIYSKLDVDKNKFKSKDKSLYNLGDTILCYRHKIVYDKNCGLIISYPYIQNGEVIEITDFTKNELGIMCEYLYTIKLEDGQIEQQVFEHILKEIN